MNLHAGHIRAIGWASIMLGVGGLISLAIMQGFAHFVVHKVAEAARQGNQSFDPSAFYRAGQIFTLIGGVASLGAIAGGVGVVRHRRWGRLALECVCWFMVAACVQQIVASFVGPPPPEFEPVFPVLRFIALGFTALSLSPAFVVLGLFLFFIRRRPVRDAFLSATRTAQPNNGVHPTSGAPPYWPSGS